MGWSKMSITHQKENYKTYNKTMKILLIDDDIFLRDMYATKFIESGHEVVSIEQAEQALRLLEEQNDFDVVLVDMVMPGMSGIEFLQKASASDLCDNKLCIVLSNQGQQADIDEALEAGAQSYIVKAEYIPSQVVKKVEETHKEHTKQT